MTVAGLIEDELKKRFVELSNPMKAIPTGENPQLKKLSGIRVIMYDFYGTLFLSGVGDIGIDDGISDAGLMNDALLGAGIKITNKKAGQRSFEIYTEVVNSKIEKLKISGIEFPEPDIRKIWGEVLQQLFDENLISSKNNPKTQSRISVEFEARMNPIWPVNNAKESLLQFNVKGFHQGIISNSQFYTPIALQALTGKTLEELGLNKNLLHWSFEEKMKKPGIQFYKNAWQKIVQEVPAITPKEVLYIGNDMLKDIWPASKLGIKTALFAGDKRSLKWRKDDERCKALLPDIVFTDFSQLSEVL